MFNIFKNNYYKNLIKETKNDKKLLYGINPKYKNQEEKLLSMYGKCDSFNKKITRTFIVTIHCLKI